MDYQCQPPPPPPPPRTGLGGRYRGFEIVFVQSARPVTYKTTILSLTRPWG